MDEAGIVLIVEDNPKILDLNRRMLEQEGCLVLTATTLAEARQRLKISSPDVAVLDIMLPDGSGLEFLSELRTVSDAPVLFLTAKADREDVMAGLEAGGNDYITKPYDIDEFRMRVLGFLRLVGGNRDKAVPTQNALCLPDRLRAKLERIRDFPLTTVVAPAGYGKTTAIRIFAGGLPPECRIFRLNVISGSVSDFWRDFSGMFAGQAGEFSEALIRLGVPADVTAQREFMRLVDSALKCDGNDAYVFIDDFHMVSGQALQGFFLFLGRHLPERVHIVILSRTPVFEPDGRFLLSGHINEITDRDLWYGPKETREYFELCGCPISDEDAARLSEATEGWIAALYLNMKSYAETGRFSETRDIHSLMEAALFSPLPKREKELLTALSLFSSFRDSQAAFVSGMEDAKEILQRLAENNSFIIRQETGGTYKLHHLFRYVVVEAFDKLPAERKRRFIVRAGLSHVNEGDCAEAERMFYSVGDFENLLSALERDCGASLTGEHKREFLSWLQDCPADTLCAHPVAMLICARCLYMYNMIRECGELLEMLKAHLMGNSRLSGRERDHLLGEAELVSVLLCNNDLESMSVSLKRARELMNRSARSISPHSPWLCGSPSVFAAYHRKSGEADCENESMKRVLPCLYELSQNHGSGAEHLFEGELHFLRANFTDALISLHRALHNANQNRQTDIACAADFLRLRIEAFQGKLESLEPALRTMRGVAEENRLSLLLHTADICEAWLCALTGQPDKAADWIAEDSLENSRVLFPGLHFQYMVYCQLLLAQGEYAALIAREDEERALYRLYPAPLCEIYLDIQLAAAYEQLGRRETAVEHLTRALELSAPDGIILPFAENLGYIAEPLRELSGGMWGVHVGKALALCPQNRTDKPGANTPGSDGIPAPGTLTERDMSVARLAAAGMSNKEIAAELYLSESRVKSYLSGIFQKLGIADKKDKRSMLALFFSPDHDRSGTGDYRS